MFKNLVSWSQREFGALPWRRDHDPYKVLVSEIMLQQTTVGTVLNHFDRFLERYPTLHDLGRASEEDVLIAWKGLGYYRRAKNLRKACEDIVLNHQGKIPADLDELLSIKGVGDYTARALLAFSFNQPALAVDANLERVLARYFGLQEFKGPKLQKLVREKFESGEILSAEMKKLGSRDLNGALMDLGRVYCQARRADCALCPLKKDCFSAAQANPLSLPRVKESELEARAQKHELSLLRLYCQKGSKVIGIKREGDEWLAGQYELPTFVISSSDTELKQYPNLPMKINYGELPSFKTTITKYKITNYVLVVSEGELAKLKVKKAQALTKAQQTNLSTASMKAIKKIGK